MITLEFSENFHNFALTILKIHVFFSNFPLTWDYEFFLEKSQFTLKYKFIVFILPFCHFLYLYLIIKCMAFSPKRNSLFYSPVSKTFISVIFLVFKAREFKIHCPETKK